MEHNIYSKSKHSDSYLHSDDLKNGIWPRSIAIWMTAFYVAIFIIRPWEQLFPWMSLIRFERSYAILMIIVVILSRKNIIQMRVQTVFIVYYFFILGISAIFALEPAYSWDIVYRYLTYVIIYFILILAIRTPYELIFIVISYIVSMTAYLAKSQWEFFIHGKNRYTMGVIRMVGIENTFGGPNVLAASIVISLPFLLFLWSKRKEISAGWNLFYSRGFSFLLISYFLLATSSIVLTNSRSGMLGFIIFVIFGAFKGQRFFKKVIYTISGILILIAVWNLAPETSKNRFRTIWDKDAGPETATTSAEGRIEGLKVGIEMFGKYPATGVGIGNFIYYRIKYGDQVALNAHNLLGQSLGETGFLGTSAFLIFVFTIFLSSRRIKLLTKGQTDIQLDIFRRLSVAINLSLILLLFEGIFGHNLLRYNWLWLAAFSMLTLQFVQQFLYNENISNEP